MKIYAGKSIGNVLLTASFLLFIFIIAGISMKQTLRAVNDITLEDATLKNHITSIVN